MNKIIIIAKREYTKVIRKPAFWISTLLLPIFIIAVSFISGLSSVQFEKNLKNGAAESKTILILDKSNFIHKEKLKNNYVKIQDESDGVKQVESGDADALIVFPSDLEKSKTIKIYEQDKGIFLQTRFNQEAESLLKDSILSELNDQQKVDVYNATYNYAISAYKDGKEVSTGIDALIIPGISLVAYFLLTMLATSYLLLSVSEEKENRVMEIMLSTVKPKELISGKILGLIGVVITQMILLIVLSIVGLVLVGGIITSQINVADLAQNATQLVEQILLGLFYTFIGFFIMACAMVGVGAAAPTYREAQQMASIFIILSIFPVYFITAILSDPNGTVAKIFSYVPFTASFVLVFRNALGALSIEEIIISGIVLIIYAYLALFVAFKLFEFGSLEYNKKISFSEFFATLRK